MGPYEVRNVSFTSYMFDEESMGFHLMTAEPKEG